MGLGGYMGAKSDAEHYFSERAREAAEVRDQAEIEAGEVAEVFESYADNRICGCTSARRSDVDRFRALRSGDYVRVEGRFLDRDLSWIVFFGMIGSPHAYELAWAIREKR
jgi:hypothetical protein